MKELEYSVSGRPAFRGGVIWAIVLLAIAGLLSQTWFTALFLTPDWKVSVISTMLGSYGLYILTTSLCRDLPGFAIWQPR